jgi:Zn-finger nucleic acid-binding protein
VCRIQADPISYEGVRIYNCGSCGGHWLTDARLDVILGRRELDMPEAVKQKMMDIADAANSSERLFCMTCGRHMVKEAFKYWDDILIDRCQKCDGIWLDRGELEKCQIYWEYAQDHPEQWENADMVARKAMLCAELEQRRAKARIDTAEAQERPFGVRRGSGARGLGLILGSIFGGLH